MSRQIKFTPFGVPYILAFEDIFFLPQPSSSAPDSRRSSSSESFCYIENPTHPPPPPPFDGIYIQFPPERSHPQLTRKQRLVRLQQTISMAVLDAGMSHPENQPSHRNRGYRSSDALFCGTYGQMMAALEGAGLSATPCTGDDLSGRGYPLAPNRHSPPTHLPRRHPSGCSLCSTQQWRQWRTSQKNHLVGLIRFPLLISIVLEPDALYLATSVRTLPVSYCMPILSPL